MGNAKCAPVLADGAAAARLALCQPPPVHAVTPMPADARAAVSLPPLLTGRRPTGPDALGTLRDDRQCRWIGSRLRDRRVLLSQRLPDLHHRRGCGRTLRPCQRERRVNQQAGRPSASRASISKHARLKPERELSKVVFLWRCGHESLLPGFRARPPPRLLSGFGGATRIYLNFKSLSL